MQLITLRTRAFDPKILIVADSKEHSDLDDDDDESHLIILTRVPPA